MSAYCTEVSAACPISETTYGYRPNLAGNIFLLVVFGICTLAQLFLGVKYKLRAFTFAVTVGCMGETLGYGGRLIMNENPWSQAGFRMQIVCLILSPSFLAAGIYLALKHLVLHFGPQYSKLKPHYYTWYFIGFDVVSILTQAAGGGIAAGDNLKLANIGNNIMVAGLCVQVATMTVCAILSIDFALRVYRSQSREEKMVREGEEQSPKAFKLFLVCFVIAFITIFIRSIYRVPEMVGGWGNPLMQNQTEFMVLDGAMVSIGAIAMTIGYPGKYFPEISSRYTQKMAVRKQLEDEMALSIEEK